MIGQTFWYSIAQAAGRVIGFGVVVLAGNVLGAALFGVFANTTTYLMLMTVFSTFGLDLWTSRHAANAPLGWKGFFGIVAWRLGLTLVAFAVFAALFSLDLIGDIMRGHLTAVVLVFASLGFDHLAMTATAVLEGRRMLAKCALLSLTRWVGFGAFAVTLLLAEGSLNALCFAFLAGSACRAVVALAIVRPLIQGQSTGFRKRDLWRLAAPMALLNFMVSLYFHIDMAMLPEMAPAEQTGWYKMAYTMIEALLFLSAGVAAALYPIFSSREIAGPEKVEHLQRGMKILSFIAFPIAWGTGLVASPAIDLLFGAGSGDFGPSARALALLAWSLPFMFINASLVRFNLGTGRTGRTLIFVTVTAVLNIGLNLVLIPRIGYMGACWSTIFCELLLSVMMCLEIVRRHSEFAPLQTLVPAFASASLVLPVGIAMHWVHPALVVPGAAMAYLAILWLGRLLTLDEIRAFGKGSDHTISA